MSFPSSCVPPPPPTVLPWSLQSWANYDIRVFGSQEDIDRYANKEHALCLLNHHCDLDWMIGWCLVERLGMLGVSCPTARKGCGGEGWGPVRRLCRIVNILN